MNRQAAAPPPAPGRMVSLRALLVLTCAIFACAVWANLSFVIDNQVNLRFIPPFEAGVNQNGNGNMRGEYYQIARAIAAGKGFAHPFAQETGPTAWQPPIFPLILAALLWVFDGNVDAVTAVRVFLQVYVLIATGLLVVAIARQTSLRARRNISSTAMPNLALTVYLGALFLGFRVWFQQTLDSWFVLLALDLVMAGACLYRPLASWKAATLWGLVGGFVAMINPAVALGWGMTTLGIGTRDRAWSRLGVAFLCAGLALAPWTIRNYLVFGRLIPVKSNLAFELYQSQCLQPDGVLTKFGMHPYGLTNPEGREYLRLGETLYLQQKWQQFQDAVANDPLEFADRVAYRFLVTTLRYTPTWPRGRWADLITTYTYPLPFLALVFLIISSGWRPLLRAQWVVIGLYVFYLLPYIGISFYERYGLPLIGVKVLLVFWGVGRLVSAVVRNS